MRATRCGHCGAVLVGRARKIYFDAFFTRLLREVYKTHWPMGLRWNKDRNKYSFIKNLVEARRMKGNSSLYARLANLKFFGFLKQREEHWHLGIYQITKKALKFIKGKATVPEYCIVRHGRVLGFSKRKLNIKETEFLHVKRFSDEYYREAKNAKR